MKSASCVGKLTELGRPFHPNFPAWVCQPFLEFRRSTSRMRVSTLVETRGEVESDHMEVVFRLKAWDSLAQGNARATPWVRRDASSRLKGCDRDERVSLGVAPLQGAGLLPESQGVAPVV